MKTIRITFPNEEFHDEVTTFNLKEFIIKNEFDDCVFGWWNEVFVKVNKEDYKILKEDEKN